MVGFFFFVLIAVVLAGVFSSISFFIGEKRPDREKVSAYECGFVPFSFLGRPFSVRFFLIGILFLIFDLEISFLFPWCVLYNSLGPFGFWAMVGFLFILTVGLVYEWLKGGLEWE
uniref:NADH-ubiquinone oxidoreductase chain 3 n=3 Tax=Caryophylliidae TaxID=46746 RepID=E9BVV2_9CNID|nr:NADH dehydrogenase subunit 3 [Desmophyllum pertusum]YP_009104310.1 NADH dehydrogenase subunit 3 [Solenosmilia variabilis]YP_009353087.1 NADH dehydrogenase subunit 3 [Desmophyllum dianthus]YP_010554976.1 NADH dehydrogenase subunit 3 [Crispatotrochus rubescens]YP_010554989.1 NADH dehydrogenase subunit 3 [Crispatotrochus rugosus]AGJ71850.1 NADH dehydrogenase subunit 3 [Desmophyllum pertusum]AGJ71863.1 NADH dehydrogenase subunit 3 [Desmophyllum pertusum]AIU56242.1 NADH dehydrogenase subunit 3